MAQGGYIGQGMKVGFSLSASPGVWLKLEQVMTIEAPTLTAARVNTTVSAATFFESNIPGMFKVADVKIGMLRDDNPSTSPNQNYLYTLVQNRATVLLTVEFHSDPDLTANVYEAFQIFARCADVITKATIEGATMLEASFLFTNSNIAGTALGQWQHQNHVPSILG